MTKNHPWCDRRALNLWSVLAALLISAAPAALVAGEVRSTADFADVADAVESYIDQYGAEHVLLVLDIDNTLLAMRRPLGSDQWFDWQETLLETDPDSPDLVADSFGGLLDVQGWLFDIYPMRTTQHGTPAIVARLQGQGIFTLVLTSRGDEYRRATERELARNGYDFEQTALAVNGVPQGTYEPYAVDDPADAGLTAEEMVKYEIRAPRAVSYMSGIYMTSGQHKGVMLLALLHHAVSEIQAVVFVDDSQQHIERVYEAAGNRGIETTVFRYTREDANVRRFQCCGKWQAAHNWRCIQGRYEAVAQ